MTAAAQMARFRVAVETGHLPPDLGRWALERLVELSPDADRVALRDSLLCQAAELLPGSTWAKARALRAEILAMGRRHSAPGEVRELVAAALEIDPGCPRSHRHLRRILGDTEAVEMSPSNAGSW